MQTKLRWASIVLFSAVSLFLLWFGLTYATVHNMLWFHAAAVPPAAREAVQPLYFALMTLIGGASGALGLLGAWVIALPLRQGVAGAGTALAGAYVLVFAMAAITAEKLAKTGAPTSWHIMGVLIAITGAAYAAHIAARRMAAASLLTVTTGA